MHVMALKLLHIQAFPPKGCIGCVYVFQSMKAARACFGKDVKLGRVEIKEVKGD